MIAGAVQRCRCTSTDGDAGLGVSSEHSQEESILGCDHTLHYRVRWPSSAHSLPVCPGCGLEKRVKEAVGPRVQGNRNSG